MVPYSVNSDGTVRTAPELKVSKARMIHGAAEATGAIHLQDENSSIPGVYPEKNWKVRIVWNPDVGHSYTPMYLEYRKDDSKLVKRVEIPQGELSFLPRPIFFDPTRELFIFNYYGWPYWRPGCLDVGF